MAALHFLSSIKSPSKNNLSTCIVLKLDYEQSLFFLLRPAKRPRHVSRPRFSRLAASSIGSLSSDVFERRTSTGNGRFALLSRDFEQIFGQIVSLRIKTLGNINTVASRLINRGKGSLPLDVRRSKTSLLKLPNQRSRARGLPLLNLKRKRDYSQSMLKTNN